MRRRTPSPWCIPGTPASFAPRCLPAAHWNTRTYCGTFWSGRPSGPPTPAGEIWRGRLRSVLTPFAAAGLFLIMIPELIVQPLFYQEIPRTLEGFVELDGLHYPRYSFSLPDGTLQRRTDTKVSLEDSVSQAEAARILRRKYPPVKVHLSRRNREKSRCVYL